MGSLIKLEMKKVFSKKDIMLILGLLIIVPVIFSICIVNHIGGLDFNGAVSIDSYGVMIWSFLKYLFVLYLVPIYIACSFIGREVENRSINIMLSNQVRSKVILAKIVTYTLVITAFFILFQFVSAGAYMIFIKGGEFAAVMEAGIGETIFLYLFQWLEMLFILLISSLFCSVIKGNAALLLGLGVVIIQKILINVDSIKRVIPYYISDYNYYSQIEPAKLGNSNIISLVIYSLIILVIIAGTINVWMKRDF